MSETRYWNCDQCGARVSKRELTTVRFGPEAGRREPRHVCLDCLPPVLVALRLAPAEAPVEAQPAA